MNTRINQLQSCFAVAASLTYGFLLSAPLAKATPPDLAYQGPIKITAPGTYSGNYRSTDNTPAIEVYTNGQVIIENCNVTGPGDLIRVWSETKLVIRNCNAYGVGTSPGKFLGSANLLSLVMENNYFENVSKGALIYQFHGQGGVNGIYGQDASNTIKIRRNIGRNIQSDSDRASFVQFNQVIQAANVEIAYNQVINEPGKSAVEDNINLYNSSGTGASPISVHDNYVQGAYPRNLNNGFTGTGITTDGDGTLTLMQGNIEAMNNTFLSNCNAAMNIAGGFNTRFHDNRIVSSSLLPDGRGEIPVGCTWAAVGVWNNFHQPENSPYYINDSADHNVIGFVRKGINVPFADRQDESPDCVGGKCHDNIHLPNPIILDSEKYEWLLWNQKLAQAQVTVGSASIYNNGSQSVGEGSNPFFGAANASGSAPVIVPAPPVVVPVTPPATPPGVTPPTAPPASGTWTTIGYEYDSLTVPTNSTLRYGTAGHFLQKTVSGSFTASNSFFGGDPASGVRKQVDLLSAGTTAPVATPTPAPTATPAPVATPVPTPVATPIPAPTATPTPPTGASPGVWQKIGGEGQTLTVAPNSTVRYGANGNYVEKIVSGSFTASNAFFGNDPAWGTYKTVEIKVSAQTWTTVGYEGSFITVPANSTVRYGVDGAFVMRNASGGFSASNGFFGSDPAYGIRKRVDLLK